MNTLQRRLRTEGVLELALADGDTFTIRRSITFTVTRGRAWVTVEGEPDDIFVGAGERFTSPRRRRTVFQGDPQCTLTIAGSSLVALGLGLGPGLAALDWT
ncbi:MAG: DUF2917 domain-containing protein [Burkholderiaceae bacterium]